MKNYFKEGTDIKIVYLKENHDIVVKQIMSGDVVIYEQRLINTNISEFTYDKMFYNELYEHDTNITNGFSEYINETETGKCVIQ